MLVCHCHVVCDRVIRECIRDGAQTTEEVGEACGAGMSCGGCRPAIEDLLKAERQDAETLYPLTVRKAA